MISQDAGMLIRAMKLDDIDEVVEMYLNYLKHFGHEVKHDKLNSFLKEIFTKGWVNITLACEGQEILGFLTFCDTFSPISTCLAFHIKDLFIKPQHRHKGIGTMLLQNVEIIARSKVVGKLFVHSEDNEISFYEKHGWKTHTATFLSKTLF